MIISQSVLCRSKYTSRPALRRCPATFSESTVFLEHPRVMMFTFTWSRALGVIVLLFFKEGFNELVGVEDLKVCHLFAKAYVAYGNLELVGDPYDYATFGSTIEFSKS